MVFDSKKVVVQLEAEVLEKLEEVDTEEKEMQDFCMKIHSEGLYLRQLDTMEMGWGSETMMTYRANAETGMVGEIDVVIGEEK